MSRHPSGATSGTALVFYQGTQNSLGEEVGTSYKLYYGTTNPPTSVAIIPAGNAQNVYVLSGLNNGAQYYFQMSALDSSGTVEGAKSLITQISEPITIQNSTGGNTVSGTITSPVTPTGALTVGVYSNTLGVYFTRIASPTTSQGYSIVGVPSGNYQFFVVLDQNGDGLIDTGDLTNFLGSNGPPPINVPSGTQNATLTLANSTTFVTTNHTLHGSVSTYVIQTGINLGAKLPVSMTLFSAPNVAVPFDMTASIDNNNYQPILSSTATPTVGDLYQFLVTYEDGSTGVITSTVTGDRLTSSPGQFGATAHCRR